MNLSRLYWYTFSTPLPWSFEFIGFSSVTGSCLSAQALLSGNEKLLWDSANLAKKALLAVIFYVLAIRLVFESETSPICLSRVCSDRYHTPRISKEILLRLKDTLPSKNSDGSPVFATRHCADVQGSASG